MQGFEYPVTPHVRRHGPTGYKSYSSYLDWLRDEFAFRCVFCLHREQWYGRTGTFEIEHFVPVAVEPDGKCEYKNLLYACATCNSAKSDTLDVPDPCSVAFGDCLNINSEGIIESLNADGRKLRDKLRLNKSSNVSYRSRWIRILKVLIESDPGLYQEIMGFPDELPDLRRKLVPANSKPEGAENCYFAIKERGELPDTY